MEVKKPEKCQIQNAIMLNKENINECKNLHLHLCIYQTLLSKATYMYSGYTFVLSVCVFPGNRTHNLCAANAML